MTGLYVWGQLQGFTAGPKTLPACNNPRKSLHNLCVRKCISTESDCRQEREMSLGAESTRRS
jgi:hypothetical protein